jgi:DNA invertase Pin-like site-specific DNA recombinase
VKVVGYIRVSTTDQADNGNGLEAQRAAIEAACVRKGWELVTVLEDRGLSGKSRKDRKALEAALAMCEAGAAQALVTAKLDRLSRSIIDFSTLMEQARRGGWAIVVLDCDFDMTTPQGELMANMLACFAQFERRVIGQRTKDALSVKKAKGERAGGRPSTLPDRVVERIQRQHAEGVALNAIAKGLNADAIPTGQGGAKWYASTVSAVLRRTSTTG